MRAIVAKCLRRIAYKKGHHPGPVGYHVGNRRAAPQMPKNLAGSVVSDQARREYQGLKRAYRQGGFSL